MLEFEWMVDAFGASSPFLSFESSLETRGSDPAKAPEGHIDTARMRANEKAFNYILV